MHYENETLSLFSYLSDNFHFAFNFYFFLFRGFPSHVLVFKHSWMSFSGMSIEPCEYHGNPGTSFNFTLYHFTGPFLFTFTTFSTSNGVLCCCWLSDVVGFCISLVVFWYLPWPDFFMLLLLPCLVGCVPVLFLSCGAAVGCRISRTSLEWTFLAKAMAVSWDKAIGSLELFTILHNVFWWEINDSTISKSGWFLCSDDTAHTYINSEITGLFNLTCTVLIV